MSMSESERRPDGSEDDLSHLSLRDWELPDDFSAEDLEFARELDGLFDFTQEEVPPYFAQTLIEPESPRFQPLEQHFEFKTNARVFRRLKLQRRLFRSLDLSLPMLFSPFLHRRSVTVVITACLLFMLATMLYASPAFANGLTFLWSGAHSGVMMTRSYPTAITLSEQQNKAVVTNPVSRKTLSFQKARQLLDFPVYWPTWTPPNYSLGDMYLYNGSDQSWADGPIIQLNYDYAIPGNVAHGSGQIGICEFKPQGKVFQLVQLGSARSVKVSNDRQSAIYVNGQWVRMNNDSHEWIYGIRSELIYERDGVVFWLVGDQRDGVDDSLLLNIARSLAQSQQHHISYHSDSDSDARVLPASINDSAWFSSEIIYLNSPGGSSWHIENAEPHLPLLDVPNEANP